MTGSATSLDLSDALAKFGLQNFRRGQKEVIEHIISGKDCLCVMPTGGGKSLCYQLPSLVRPGLTIVVSPLIALMKDQVDGLERRGIRATLINSSLTMQEQAERLDQVSAGKFSLVYVAPERLRNQKFLDAIRATPIQLLAIDEAHCISEWGHDFRPDYHRLGRFREALGNVQTIALTATATPRVRKDILDSLQLSTARTFITGFARDNLYFGSVYSMSDRDKDKNLIEFLEGRDESGIIYVATRKRCESLVEKLTDDLKLPVAAYHAGLLPEQRKHVQDQFMAGKLKAIVATNAFGMGIDKSDLRYVIHYNMPGTLEAYYQEAGRAGRDGLLSQCVLLFSPQDRYIQEFFIENANPSKDILQSVYDFLLRCEEDPIELTAEEIREKLDRSTTAEAVNSALQILGRTGVLERLEVAGGLAMFRLSNRLSTFIDLLPRDATARRNVLRMVEKAIGDRRDEAVYIHPRWLMEQLQMDRETMNRHLRELNKLEDFEYVPPFRGRAIHFRRKDVHFNDLKIDHAALAARRKADYEKLDQMVDYARSKACRQKTILLYFGDSSASDCKICDRCQGRSGWPKLPKQRAVKPSEPSALASNTDQSLVSRLSDETPIIELSKTSSGSAATQENSSGTSPQPNVGTKPKGENSLAGSEPRESIEISKAKRGIETKKIGDAKKSSSGKKPPVEISSDVQRKAIQTVQLLLSAIERTHGYLSKTVLAQHFAGTASKSVTGLRLERLPEFGVLKPWKKTHSAQALEVMLEGGLLAQAEFKLGKQTLILTEIGKSCRADAGAIPKQIIDFFANAWHVSDVGETALELPKQSAKQREATWESPTATQDLVPRDDAAQGTVGRMPDLQSPAPLDLAAPLHLAAPLDLAVPRSPVELPVPQASDAQSTASGASVLSDWQWTVRLVKHGYRLGEIALIRGKTPDGVLADLTIAMQMDERFEIRSLFDARTYLTIEELAKATSLPEKPPTLLLVFSGLWDFVLEWLKTMKALK
jgi:ATP-dependent DNA helicase RecQ